MVAVTDGPALFGNGYGFGGVPFVGEHPANLESSDIGQGLPAMVANDRHQIIALVRDGADSIAPEFRHWLGGPVEWAELIGARSRSQVVPRYATDEDRELVVGVVELPAVHVDKGAEITVEGIIVEVDVRPTAIGTLDGGLAANTEIGFSAYVEAWGSFDVQEMGTTLATVRAVIRSDVESWSIPAGGVDSTYFPARFAVRLPCRIESHVRSYRIGVTNLRGCEFVAAEAHGRVHTSRLS